MNGKTSPIRRLRLFLTRCRTIHPFLCSSWTKEGEKFRWTSDSSQIGYGLFRTEGSPDSLQQNTGRALFAQLIWRPRCRRFLPLDRKLCVPTFRQVCLFQIRCSYSNKIGATKVLFCIMRNNANLHSIRDNLQKLLLQLRNPSSACVSVQMNRLNISLKSSMICSCVADQRQYRYAHGMPISAITFRIVCKWQPDTKSPFNSM